ncbi:MAG: hypothetical protein LBD31_10935, partial [Treponema sp.]|nr:hypothetical protein [Treponema sp.]
MNKKIFSLRLAVTLVSGLLVLSCMNPIGFNPDLKLEFDVNANVSGEIGIDSVNSAEIQIRNHTKSIDIYKTDIVYAETGATPPESTAARITGAPVAGTQESILLRPMKADPRTMYKVQIWYREAQGSPAGVGHAANPSWDFGANNAAVADKSLEIRELPRGKYVIHVYRKVSGDIGIAVDDDTSNMTDMNDNHQNADFVTNVKVNNVIDLSGAEINLTMPGGGLNVNTSVSFSTEVTALFNSLIEAINANRPYPNGYGMVIVRNHTSQQLSNIEFTKAGNTVGLPGVIRAEDQNGMILSKGTWEAKLNVAGYASNPVGPKNILLANGGKEYLHVYKNKSGGYSFVVSEREWTGDLILSLSDADSSYSFTVNININTPNTNPNKGALFIHNMTTKLLDAPDPGKMHIVSQDLSPAATYDLAVGAKATIGGLVDPSNYDVSVGTKSTTVFVSHMQPTHVYYYKTRDGNYNISDYWPPHDADQSEGIGIELGPEQAVIVVKNRSDFIIDMFSWMAHEYEIELTSGDDVATVVEAGTSPIGFMVRGGSYGEYVTRTVNPGQILTITVQGNQIIDITPPIVITPPPPPPIIPPVTYDQTIVFKHETGYDTPIEYLILYR